ncbi:iron-containing alcohol dehydrogenase [Nitrosopumilus sp.]|uniref:iron-containing alcohol dehydrogenase n=1 Tax=Nitrosopumilus sp. TaxID=2024843 RepID=UPI00247CAFEE|nr:iron-containing alcohol dehydrogenase [Nitrosopumilus sp.]MCV0430396.1 iron-containing alcohol dehydrogenase [Nitrosopumilus sp.]
MFTIKQPPKIIFGKNSVRNFSFPLDSLVITSKGAKSRGWLEYLALNDFLLFEDVEPNPSIETTEKIISKFRNDSFSTIIGVGGGSTLDVAKFVAAKLNKSKILIPTTFGSGSEVTRISVLKVNGKKQSFHDDKLFADISIVDSNFITNTPLNIIKNSAIDACAQCTEAYDSKIANQYTKFLCEHAFNCLESAILSENFELLPYGSLITGLGFGNSSTTLGHALSYVYSNEGYSHGHALSYTTSVAHKFNNSKFYDRFKTIVKKLNFEPIHLDENYDIASELILKDKKHLDNNPKFISKDKIIELLHLLNSKQFYDTF